jgi:hypothetical protein
MSSPTTLTQGLLSSLLDTSTGWATEQVASKAVSIVRAHFQFTAEEMTQAYQNSYAYTLVSISIGLSPKFMDKLHAKVSREFANQIEQHYLKPFAKAYGIDSEEELSAFCKQAADTLKEFANHKKQLFQIEEITDEDLSALVSYKDTLAITDLVLEQMRNLAQVDDRLADFLRYDGLLGDGVLFFFRELVRKDDRLAKTQTALQQEGLLLEMQNLHAAVKTAESNLKQAMTEKSSDIVELALQLQTLQQTQLRQERLMRFSSRFETQMGEMLELIKQMAASHQGAEGQPSTRKVEENEITESTMDIAIKGDEVTLKKNTIKGSNISINIS